MRRHHLILKKGIKLQNRLTGTNKNGNKVSIFIIISFEAYYLIWITNWSNTNLADPNAPPQALLVHQVSQIVTHIPAVPPNVSKVPHVPTVVAQAPPVIPQAQCPALKRSHLKPDFYDQWGEDPDAHLLRTND